MRRALEFKPAAIQIDYSWGTPELVAEIKSHGSRVLLKTLNIDDDQSEVWRRAFELGADVILTDKFREVQALARELRRASR